MDNNTLYHYGVLGMKWGRRKPRYITVYQAKKNATKAAEEARKKSVAESRASGDKGIGSFARANRKALNAKRKAYGESMTKDLAYNKQLRAEKKASSGKNRSEDHVRAKALKKKKLSQLSNTELKELNNRMQLESQYKNLKKQNISAGQKFVKDVVYESGKQLAAEYTKKYAKKGIELVGMTLGTK